MSPVQIILNEEALDDKSSLPTKCHSPVPSAKTKFLYNSEFILFADLLYWKMIFFSLLKMVTGHVLENPSYRQMQLHSLHTF